MIEREELIGSTTSAILHWTLRIAVAACFIGHGAFGVITKAAWLPYFAIFRIPEAWAWRLMPVVGFVDITVGALTLIQPVRAVVLYMMFWGFQTACLRPVAGQGMWELLERAGNYGVPLAFLCVLGAGRSLADWFSFRPAPPLTLARASAIGWILRVTTALLLIGHGGFDFAMGKDWASYGAAAGISPTTLATHPLSPMAGWFECCSSSWRGSSRPRPSDRSPVSRYGNSSSAAEAMARHSRWRGFKGALKSLRKRPTRELDRLRSRLTSSIRESIRLPGNARSITKPIPRRVAAGPSWLISGWLGGLPGVCWRPCS